MNNKIMVSINCLVFNHEKYLRKCLDGFVMQKTDFKYEVLIHDDASTDKSADIIREYQEKYPNIIKPIYQTENQHSKGVKISKTIQFPRVTGKYIAFCEGDDYWDDPNKLQEQFDIMEANENCAICVHTVRDINEHGKLMGTTHPKNPISEGVIKLEEYIDIITNKELQPFQTSSYFIKKEVLMELISNPPKFAEVAKVGDTVYVLYALTKGNLYYINKAMSCYRMNSVGSWSETMNKDISFKRKHFESLINMFSEYNTYTKNIYSKSITNLIEKRQFFLDLISDNPRSCLKIKNWKYLKNLSAKEIISIILKSLKISQGSK